MTISHAQAEIATALTSAAANWRVSFRVVMNKRPMTNIRKRGSLAVD